ncbi:MULTISPECIES: hypothetical protein [Flavobacterium]|uniref:Uncharacterized protein n=1 Tax=Flavobacterium jumunjinense TaxID=998845 RepID=A0ABV5GS27_9FLAO|nr:MULTISPECIES: hypothetical protein [Flavobacterium]
MALIEVEGNYPKRIGNYVIYESRGQMIIRSISGFTTKGLKSAKKYERCRENATEFGKVSSLCKVIRMCLKGILPKQNNLAVVNSLTKKMRTVMTCDSTSERGKRTLAIALQTIEAKKMLEGYYFNPDAAIDLHCSISDCLEVNATSLTFPKKANYLGAKVHCFTFNFTTQEAQLTSSAICFYGKKHLPDYLHLPIVAHATKSTGIVFTILELGFFSYTGGAFVPVADDSSKVVKVVDVATD